MPIGPAGLETLTLNLDTLCTGRPFEVTNYTGGNPNSSLAFYLPGIRDCIFTNGTGNVTELQGSDAFYGSYQVLGNLTVAIPSLHGNDNSVLNYRRTLDINNGIHATNFSTNASDFETSVFCSFPDQVCVYTVRASQELPPVEVHLNNDLVDPELQNVTCGTGQVRMRGVTQLGPPEGMLYDCIARIVSRPDVTASCNNEGNDLTIVPQSGTKSVSIVVGAETNYDAKKGAAKFGYSFKGQDPAPAVEKCTQDAATKTFEELDKAHVEDFAALTGRFELSLPDTLNSSRLEISNLTRRYSDNDTRGDAYLRSLLFDYGNYLFISSSRPGSLPPNLQGRWAESGNVRWMKMQGYPLLKGVAEFWLSQLQENGRRHAHIQSLQQSGAWSNHFRLRALPTTHSSSIRCSSFSQLRCPLWKKSTKNF
jgi:alpha-L-fucosidase 2